MADDERMGSVLVEPKLNRRVAPLCDGIFQITQEFVGCRHGQDVSGKYWILGIFKILAGTVEFLGTEKPVICGEGIYAMYLPPWTIAKIKFHDSHVFTVAFAGDADSAHSQKDAVVFRIPKDHTVPRNQSEIRDLIDSCEPLAVISTGWKKNATARKVKAYLDQNYQRQSSIEELLNELGIQRSVASRDFKAAYDFTMKDYRKWLRIVDGMFQIMEGVEPITVATDMGYGDLSRFYKQFKEVSKSTPGDYGAVKILSQNAKTNS